MRFYAEGLQYPYPVKAHAVKGVYFHLITHWGFPGGLDPCGKLVSTFYLHLRLPEAVLGKAGRTATVEEKDMTSSSQPRPGLFFVKGTS